MNLNRLIGTPIGILRASGDGKVIKQSLHAGCSCGCNQCQDAKDDVKVKAGGAGSGCQGPNCGRPSSGGVKKEASSPKSYGYKKTSSGNGETQLKMTDKDGREHLLKIRSDDSWEHQDYKKGGGYGNNGGQGSSKESMMKHLSNVHKGATEKQKVAKKQSWDEFNRTRKPSESFAPDEPRGR